MKMVEVEAVRPHDNNFGDKEHKAVGNKYSLTPDHAELLKGLGLVKDVPEKVSK